jgi:hypothetical protein
MKILFMKNILLACVLLMSCGTTSKVNSTKVSDSSNRAMAKSTPEAYPTIYKNIGDVSHDTTRPKN